MKIKSEKLLGLAVFIIAAVLFSVSAFTVYASSDNYGTLTLICKTDDAVLSGMDMKIYYAASRQSDGSFKLDGNFAEYPVLLDDMSTSALGEAAVTLENYAVVDNITPDLEGITDSEGEVVFENLPTGLYLVTGEPVDIDGMRYTPAAALVELDPDGGELDLSVYPKFTVSEIPSSEAVEYRVVKLWENDSEASRPESITVELYCNGELRENVILNDDNGWSYQWQGAADEQWRVKEIDVAQGYHVSYIAEEALIEIVNKYGDTTTVDSSEADASSETESNPGGGNLPQTGMFWWSVPAFSAAGLILAAIGIKLNSKEK